MSMCRFALLPALAWTASAACTKPGVAYGDAAGSAAVPSAGFTADAAGCATTCGGDVFCKAYTWKENTSPKGGCWHFSIADPSETMDVGAVSGPKVCDEGTLAGASGAVDSLGSQLGDIGDAVAAGVNDAVDSMNGEATAAAAATAGAALPTVPPPPDAAVVPAKAAAAVVTDATLPTVAPLPEAAEAAAAPVTATMDTGGAAELEQKAKAQKENGGGPGFAACLLLVVLAAFSLRICAHYSFNDYNNAKREEKNKRAKSDAADKQAQRDDEEAAKSAPASPYGVVAPAMVMSQGAVLSGYGAQPMVMPTYQGASPTVSGYAPVVSVGTQQYVMPA